MSALTKGMLERLSLRQASAENRKLQFLSTGIDFLSSDYLGLARSQSIKDSIAVKVSELPLIGSTSSRLLSGNHELIVKLEQDLASFFRSERSLLFTSAYSLNVGLLAACANESDILILDEQAHTSLKNSLKLSSAKGYFFRHNDLSHLQKRLKNLREIQAHKKEIIVVVESLYSMDGDFAPLAEIVEICEKYGAYLIVDEAHAAGVVGPGGRGLVSELGLEKKVLARIVGFGKGFGTSGGLLLGSHDLMDYITNFCHSFIYTTGISFLNALSIQESLSAIRNSDKLREQLSLKVKDLREMLDLPNSDSPILSLRQPSVSKLSNLVLKLREKNFLVQPIFSPTVRKGSERLRVCLHSYNTKEEIDFFFQELGDFL